MTIPHLHTFDLVLIVFYLLGITLFGLRFRRSQQKDTSLRNYFLADNTAPWWAIALSIVSAETSTLTIISVPGVAFAGDFGFLQIVIGYMIGRVVVAMLFLPRYFEGRMLTAYQLIDQRFGHALHKVTAGLFLATRAAAEGARVFAVSIVVGIAIGTRDVLSIALISALTLLYTFEGGMAAVIWTDVVQMAIYIGGTLVALFTLGSHVPGGWAHIHEVAAAAGKFHTLNFALNLTQSYTFWAGALGGTFLTMASHGTDQLMVQRMLAARNLRESRLALLSSGVIIFLQFTLFLLIGAGLYVFYGPHPQNLPAPDRIFPAFIVAEMPIGIAGLLIAAILAAAMSNLSAALNSLSSTSVVDFYMHWRPEAGSRERMFVSRSTTVVWAIVLFVIAIYSAHAGGKGHVVEIGLSIASVAYGALLGVFLLGSLTQYATQTGAICGMIVGFAFNLILWLQPPLGITIPKIAFTWYVFLGALVTFAVGSLFSLVFRAPRKAAASALLLCLALTPSFTSRAMAQAPSTAPSEDFAPVSDLMEQAIVDNKLPGAVVLIGHRDHVVFEHAYGARKLSGEPGLDGKPSPAEPMTTSTVFDMASMTKVLVTSVAVMQLYEQHLFSLDDPVAKFLPAFAVNGKQNVTIRDLLTHYSGLPPDIDMKDPWGLGAPDKAEGLRRAMASTLNSKPGTHFEYSDINFITLGYLVEVLSNESLDYYAQTHIFEPLGMEHTSFRSAYPCNYIVPPNQLSAPKTPNEIDDATLGTSTCSHSVRPLAPVAQIAPTTHDDESKDNPAANPDFDHLLRGVVNDPSTRRMGGVAGHAGVFSTAADVSKFAQALLDKLVHNQGPFPLQQATLRLMTEPQQPSTAENGATVFTADGKPTKGVALRGLGWDINSAFSRPRGSLFPTAPYDRLTSFGHTGFTGTSLWIDPGSDTYVILLSNAIHPRGRPAISVLRGAVATAVARVLHLYDTATLCGSAIPSTVGDAVASHAMASTVCPTQTGIDVLEATNFKALSELAARHGNHLRIGLLTNQTGVDSLGRRTIDVLTTQAPHFVPGLELTTIFSPEHGVFGKEDSEHPAAETVPGTNIPVEILYGPTDADRRPRVADLRKLDAVLIDLQDAGVRFYTYETVTGYFVEAAAAAGIDLVVLDRPNMVGGVKVEGPVSDPPTPGTYASYINYMPLPVRNGLTLGELARYINGEKQLHARLSVVPMQSWNRAEYFDQTGLAWNNPSPNLRSFAAAVLYPGVAFLETTNVSVGRGTDTPFEQIAAPYLRPTELADYLASRHIPGVSFTATSITIAEDKNHYPYHGQTIPALHMTATDRDQLDTSLLGLELLAAMHHLYPTKFNLPKAEPIVASAATMQALAEGKDPREIEASWQNALDAFRERRQNYLLYR